MRLPLPFLEESKWPTSREPEERVVNPSYDKQLEDHLMDELLIALEHKNPSKVRESLIALIQNIYSEGE